MPLYYFLHIQNRGEQLESLCESNEMFLEKAYDKKGGFAFGGRSSSKRAEVARTVVTSPVTSTSGLGASATFLIDRPATIDRYAR